MKPVLQRPDVAEILHHARIAEMVVETRTGPHVTPAAFGFAAGRLWLVISRNTVKVRAIRKRPVAALLIQAKGRSLVVAGRTEVLSPWGFDDVGNMITNYVPSLIAAASYTERNRELLSGTFFDMLGRPGQTNPVDRVVVAVRAQRGLVMDGYDVIETWGRWSSLSRLPRRAKPRRVRPVTPLLARVPRAAAAASDGGSPTLGWMTASGPVALPASPLQPGNRVEVSADAVRVVGAPARSAACLTFDRTKGSRPSRFAGVILRGDGVVVAVRSKALTAQLDVDRISWWSGFRTGTVARRKLLPG
jgi:hypothetical protein